MSLFKQFMEEESASRVNILLSKPQLQDAINAMEQWVTDNQVSFNQAIPQPARNNLTTKQKLRLLYGICKEKYLES